MNTNLNKILIIVVAILVFGLTLLWFLKPNRVSEQVVDPNVSVRELIGERTTEVVSGKIIEVKGDTIILDAPEILGVGIPEGAILRTRVVNVTSGVSITARVKKDDDTLLKELRKYKPDAGAPPPSPYSEKSIAFSELAVGDFVFVRGPAGIDIGQMKEIVAASIVRSK